MEQYQNMKVVLITEREHKISHPQITVVGLEEGKRLASQLLKNTSTVSNDYETTGENPYLNIPLLGCWHSTRSEDPILIIDHTCIPIGVVVTNEILHNKTIIAHNADFEARWNLRHGLWEGEYRCTMINDQLILSGATGVYFNLVDTCRRRGVVIPEWMNKDVRREFIGANKDFIFEDKHILYNACDAIVLPILLESQEKVIARLNIQFLVHIRSQLVKILARGENYGFVHNSPRWAEIANQKEDEAKRLCDTLTQTVQSQYGLNPEEVNPVLAQLKIRNENKIKKREERREKLQTLLFTMVEKGKEETKAYKTAYSQLASLAEDTSIGTTDPTLEKINWGSSQQVLKIFNKIGCPIPMGVDKKAFGKKPSVGKEARNDWFSQNDGSQFIPVMKGFDKYKKLAHNIKSFGLEWIKTYTNEITGKVHTIFRQAGTRTLRFASGDESKRYFNLQQIPGEVDDDKTSQYYEHAIYRECFGTLLGRSITTLDYTGCEVICMVSLSGDLKLKAVTDLPDQHSYMGTKCWRAVYADRYKRTGDEKWKVLSETYEMSSATPEGKKARKKFKESGIFPVIYGVKESKVASVQGFTPAEGKIFIETIEGEMPVVIQFVKSCAESALRKGYVIHNTRTNSRRWFNAVLDSVKYDMDLSRRERSKIENAARNAPVQGTNVDIICEAMVLIDRWRRLYKVDIEFMGQVHDELLYDHPDSLNALVKVKLKELMKRAAKNYLIEQIYMDAEARQGKTWLKDEIKPKTTT